MMAAVTKNRNLCLEFFWLCFAILTHPAIVPIEGAVLFELSCNLNNTAPSIGAFVLLKSFMVVGKFANGCR
jgi:hypothetical protein